MSSLYSRNTVVGKLKAYLSRFFSRCNSQTRENLVAMALFVIMVENFYSVRHAFLRSHDENISQKSLSAYYYTLKNAVCDIEDWISATVAVTLSVIPEKFRSLPVVLAIDDSMVEKKGDAFEDVSTLFDHAAHNGTPYLKGHCFVSCLISVPVADKNGKAEYISVPAAYRMWKKGGKSKLDIAAELVSHVMKSIPSETGVLLLCDSWYPKNSVAQLVEKHENLNIICNARIDTYLCGIPERKKGPGRPKKYGDKIGIEQIELKQVTYGDWNIGTEKVLTHLWGAERPVYAIVTQPKGGSGSKRLFLCTADPSRLVPDLELFPEESCYRKYGTESVMYLPLAFYTGRWPIEVCYYEQKAFWSLGDYRVRSSEGIERLINLQTICYGATTLLPYVEPETFGKYQGMSPQETRNALGECIYNERIIDRLVRETQNEKNGLRFRTFLDKFREKLCA